MKLSIIIPVYNISECLQRCIDSILNQNLDKSLYEIIAVNDGSTDDSLSILQAYESRCPNLKIVDKNNGGVSSARNKGIEESTGDFLLFVDADDTIKENSLTKTYNQCHDNPQDITVMISYLYGKEYYRWIDKFQDNIPYNCLDVLNRAYVRGSVCGCVFSRKLVYDNNIRFKEGIRNGEDTIFFFLSMYYAQNMIFSNIPFYDVVGRPSSASRSYSLDRVSSSVKSIEYVQCLSSKLDASKPVYPLIEYLKYAILSNITWDCFHTPNAGLSTLRAAGITKYCHINTNGLKYQLKKIKLLNTSFTLFYFIFWLKQK